MAADSTRNSSGNLFASRDFLNSLGQGVLLINPSAVVVEANDAAVSLLGVAREELLMSLEAYSAWQVTREDGSPLPSEDFPAAVTLRTHSHCRGVIVGLTPPASTQHWLSVDSHPLMEGERFLGVSVVFSDVTDHVNLQHELRATTERLEILAKFPADVVVLATAEAVGEWCSDSITELLGWSPDDVVGQRIDAFVHPDDLGSIVSFRRGQPEASTAHFTVRLRRRDGKYRWVAISSRKFVDAVTGQTRMISSWRDVDALVSAQRELEASEERFRYLAENASDIVAEADDTFHITWVSPSVTSILGWRSEDVIGRSVLSFVADDLTDRLTSWIEELRAEHSADSLKLRLRSSSGDQRWMLGRVRARLDDSGHATSYTLALRDIHDEEMVRRELQHSEARYRLLAENGADLVLMIGANDVIRWASASSLELFGWSPEELVGHEMSQFVDSAHVTHRDAIRDAANGLFSLDTVEFRCADGSRRWVSGRGRRVHDAQGKLDFVVASLRDVHDQVAAEHELARSEALFRLVLENQADVTARLDMLGAIEWITPSVYPLIGLHPDEVIGHNIVDYLHPDDLVHVAEVIARVQGGDPADVEARVVSASGESKWVATRVQPLLVDGTQTGSVINVRDISAEYDVRTRLAQREEQLRMTLASAPVGMAVIGPDRRFLNVNPALCEMVGRDAQWLLEHRVYDVFGTEDQEIEGRLNQSAATGAVVRAPSEKRLLRPDGTPVWIEHAIAVIKDESGEPVFFVATFVDVTESRAAKEKLRYQATHDTLTHLVNRGDLYLQAEALQRRVPRTGEAVGVLFIDVDDFKNINDTHGHYVGDMTLKAVADRITARGRSEDVVARVGGDEFVILLQALHSVEDALLIARQILARFVDPVAINGLDLTIRISIGVALAAPRETADDAMRHADVALYRAKMLGGGQAVAWDEIAEE